jgi:uridine kinase
LEGILKQYFSFVKPSNENYVHKQAQVADIVIPHGPLNTKAIGTTDHALIADVVAKHISFNLAEKSEQHILDLKALAQECDSETNLPSNIIILKQTNQLRAMTTIIRDQLSEREDFIFYLERTSSVVLEW